MAIPNRPPTTALRRRHEEQPRANVVQQSLRERLLATVVRTPNQPSERRGRRVVEPIQAVGAHRVSSNRFTGMPAASARRTQSSVPRELGNTNARQCRAPALTIA